MILLENIIKRFGKKKALDSVTLEFNKGDISFICGPNGAGKTTILRIITGILKPDKGNIQLKITREKISFMFHSICLIEELSLLNNLYFFSKLKKQDFDIKKARKYASILGLEDVLNKKIMNFSEGMKKKADFLRILLEDSQFILLDEPTANMDPIAKLEIREIIKKLAKEGKGIVITSHLLTEVEKFADKIFILDKGKLKWKGSREILNIEGKDLERKFVELIKEGEEPNALLGKN